MTLKEFCELSREEQIKWLDSDEHQFDCAAANEGQLCCLEKLMGLDKE